MIMSDVKRCETVSGQPRGPFYSRYTEHKVAFSFQSTDDTFSNSIPSPKFTLNIDKTCSSTKSSSSENPYPDSLSGSLENPFSPDRPNSIDQQHYLETSSDFHKPVSRGSSFDSLPSLRTNSLEFRALSPRFAIDENHVTISRESSSDLPPGSISPGTSVDAAREKRFVFFEKNSLVNNNNNCYRGKFANLVRKHSVNIKRATAFKTPHINTRREELTHSCPNLIRSPSREDSKKKTVSIGELGNLSLDSNGHNPTRTNKLKVPDIFTTSFTHSSPKDRRGHKTSSLQDIPETRTRPNKEALRKTISLTRNPSEDLRISDLVGPNMYRDDQLSQVTEYMFIGTIESAFNERRLCRLEIESLVDISNLSEMQVPSHRKTKCPCLCQTEFHFRSRLIIAVADEENENIDQYFEEVSKFIEGARRCSKKVLIYSLDGKSRVALFAIQYLMAYEGLLLRQAYNMVRKQRPQISLNPSFHRTLEKLEKTLFPDEKHSVNICNEYLNVADPQAIKCAWIDC